MTGRELIEWILKNRAEDYAFEVLYRDAGGPYYGTDKELYLEIETADGTTGEGYDRVLL